MYVQTRVLPFTQVECFSFTAKANTAPQAIVLVGLPGSGKSTYRNKVLIPSLKFRKRSFAIYSTDDYIEEIAAAENVPYSDIFDKRFKEAKKLAQESLDLGLAYGCDLIFDQTNLSEAKRKSILDKLPHTYARSCVYFEPTQPGQHEAMLAGRKSKVIPESVIKSMRDQYVRPYAGEGWDSLVNYWDNAPTPIQELKESA